MTNVYLNHIATHVPETVLTNKDVVSNVSTWDEEKVYNKLGFKERRIVKAQEFASDLAIGAVNKLMEQTSLDQIDFILYCTQSPDYLIPSNAFLLHNHFKFSKKVGALDYNLGCSGYVYGLGMAKALVASKQAKNILLVTAETYSKIIAPEDTSNRLIFGDGASASIISNTPQGKNSFQIEETKYGTDGSGWDQLRSGIGGLRRFYNPEGPETFLSMNGQEVLLFTLREVPIIVQDILEANNLKDINEVQHYIFHQANKLVIDQISKKMKLYPSLVRNNMEMFSNTVSTTIPIVLEKILSEGIVNQEDKIALVGFGVGFSWAGTILIKS
jgi:3-oxoacyl-[acyl-carrier-protein] synthase-3